MLFFSFIADVLKKALGAVMNSQKLNMLELVSASAESTIGQLNFEPEIAEGLSRENPLNI